MKTFKRSLLIILAVLIGLTTVSPCQAMLDFGGLKEHWNQWMAERRGRQLIEAIETNNDQWFDTLMMEGANVNAVVKFVITKDFLLKVLPKNKSIALSAIPPHTSEPATTTPLLAAVCTKRTDFIKRLLMAFANIDFQDAQGSTALMYAAQSGCPDICNQLITANANLMLCDKRQNTLLIIATRSNDPTIIGIIIEELKKSQRLGLLINAINHHGETALIAATKYALLNCQFAHENRKKLFENLENIIRILLNAGATIAQKDTDGCTALDYAEQLLLDTPIDAPAIHKIIKLLTKAEEQKYE